MGELRLKSESKLEVNRTCWIAFWVGFCVLSVAKLAMSFYEGNKPVLTFVPWGMATVFVVCVAGLVAVAAVMSRIAWGWFYRSIALASIAVAGFYVWSAWLSWRLGLDVQTWRHLLAAGFVLYAGILLRLGVRMRNGAS